MTKMLENLEARTLLASVAINANTQYQTMLGMGAGLSTHNTRSEYTDPAFYDKLVNDLGATATRWAILPTFEGGNDNGDANVADLAKFDANSLAVMMGPLQAMRDRGVTMN